MNFIKNYLLLAFSILAIAIAGFFLYDSFAGYYIHPSEGIARTTGRAIAWGFMIFFAANFMRKRWELKRLEFWIFCFAISFSLCATYDSIKINIKVHQVNNTKKEIALIAEGFDSTAPQQYLNEYSKEKYGDYSEIIPIIKNALESSDDMVAEINEACANIADLLTPENLSEYKKILMAKNQIAIFTDKLNLYKKGYIEEANRRESEIKKAFAGNESLKRQVLIGFEEGKKISEKLMNEYFQVEDESVLKITAILDFLSTKSGSFWESDGMFVFEKDEDADMFNQLAQNLIEHSQKEDLVIEKLERHRQAALQKMQNFDKD
jgi:hypothetical protein